MDRTAALSSVLIPSLVLTPQIGCKGHAVMPLVDLAPLDVNKGSEETRIMLTQQISNKALPI